MSLLLVVYRFTALINCLYWNITFCIRFLFIICCNRSCGLFKYSKNWLIDVNFAVFAKIPTDSSNVDENIMTQIAGIKGSENIENKNVQTTFSVHEHKWTCREWFLWKNLFANSALFFPRNLCELQILNAVFQSSRDEFLLFVNQWILQ